MTISIPKVGKLLEGEIEAFLLQNARLVQPHGRLLSRSLRLIIGSIDLSFTKSVPYPLDSYRHHPNSDTLSSATK